MQCDEDDKIQDNMKDTTDLHFDALTFSKELLHAGVVSPAQNFPKNPPAAKKMDVVSVDPEPWRDLGLELDANKKSVKLFKEETYNKQPILFIYKLQVDAMGEFVLRLHEEEVGGLKKH